MRPTRTGEVALPWGIFGAGNIGDEAMLQGFGELLRGVRYSPARVWVGSRNPSHVATIEPEFKYFNVKRSRDPRRWWALRRSSAYLVVGDTPVMDYLGQWPLVEILGIVHHARNYGRKIAFLGVGTETLINDRSIARIRDEIAPVVEHWTVRTEQDKRRLMAYGVGESRVTVGADLAWLVPPADASFGSRWLKRLQFHGDGPLVGVNLTNDQWSRERAPHLLSLVGDVLDTLIVDHDAAIMLFSNEVRSGKQFDSAALRTILDRARHPSRMFLVPNRYWHPQQAMSFVACCAVTLTMRYHFALFSALQGVPFVSLSRLGKLADLCVDLKWHMELKLEDSGTDYLRHLMEESMRRRKQLSQMLGDIVPGQVSRARNNIRSLDAVLPTPRGHAPR